MTDSVIGLSPQEWLDLAAAQWALLRAERMVRTRPMGDLLHVRDDATASLSASAQSECRTATGVTMLESDLEGDNDGQSRNSQVTRRLTTALERAACRGLFRPGCLVRTIALQQLLEQNGFRGTVVRIGVRLTDHGLLAHAWLEHRGRILGDRPEHISEFAELTAIHAEDLR